MRHQPPINGLHMNNLPCPFQSRGITESRDGFNYRPCLADPIQVKCIRRIFKDEPLCVEQKEAAWDGVIKDSKDMDRRR